MRRANQFAWIGGDHAAGTEHREPGQGVVAALARVTHGLNEMWWATYRIKPPDSVVAGAELDYAA